MSTPDPRSFLPLSEVVFEILLAIGDGERHGYHIIQDAEQRTGGRLVLHAGTLYRALDRLRRDGLLQEVEDVGERGEHRDAESVDGRRRYYRLTRLGIAVGRAEAARLASQVVAARGRRWLKPRPRTA